MVGNGGNVTNVKVWIETSSGVGDNDHLDTKTSHHIDGQDDSLHVVSFVGMKASSETHCGDAGKASKDQLSGMTRHSTMGWKAWNVGIGHVQDGALQRSATKVSIPPPVKNPVKNDNTDEDLGSSGGKGKRKAAGGGRGAGDSEGDGPKRRRGAGTGGGGAGGNATTKKPKRQSKKPKPSHPYVEVEYEEETEGAAAESMSYNW